MRIFVSSLVAHQQQFIEGGGLNVLIALLTDAEDPEMAKAIKYVLQVCVDVGKVSFSSMLYIYTSLAPISYIKRKHVLLHRQEN